MSDLSTPAMLRLVASVVGLLPCLLLLREAACQQCLDGYEQAPSQTGAAFRCDESVVPTMCILPEVSLSPTRLGHMLRLDHQEAAFQLCGELEECTGVSISKDANWRQRYKNFVSVVRTCTTLSVFTCSACA